MVTAANHFVNGWQSRLETTGSMNCSAGMQQADVRGEVVLRVQAVKEQMMSSVKNEQR